MEKTKIGSGAIVVIGAIAILIIVTVVGIIVLKQRSAMMVEQQKEAQTTAANASPTGMTEKTGVIPMITNVVVKPADITDTKLDADFVTIDNSMNLIGADAAGIDAGLNDQMGDLSE
jgi:hypothetical protein